jgi:uncharacterized membrane protein
MNLAHVHLMLNHVPVLGSIFALLLLGAALVRKSIELQKVGLVVLVLVAVAALPVYFTGEPAEEVVEHYPGVSEAMIEQHQDAAKLATVGIEVVGLIALSGLWFSRRSRANPRPFVTASLILGLVVAGLMLWVANLGGQIHHPEIRSNAGAAADQRNIERHGESTDDD